MDEHVFNKGAIMNAAFLEARKLHNFTCFVFHDVDMVPETDFALYRCRDSYQVGSGITFNDYLHNEQIKIVRLA